MFVVTHGQRGSERFEWQSVHKVGEMWEQHKDAMEWPYWFMEGKIVRDPAGQLGQDRWWAGGTPRRTVFSHSIVRGIVLLRTTWGRWGRRGDDVGTAWGKALFLTHQDRTPQPGCTQKSTQK